MINAIMLTIKARMKVMFISINPLSSLNGRIEEEQPHPVVMDCSSLILYYVIYYVSIIYHLIAGEN